MVGVDVKISLEIKLKYMSKCGPTQITGHEPINGVFEYSDSKPLRNVQISQKPGLTIRQYFTGQAMARSKAPQFIFRPSKEDYFKWAEQCVAMADAIIDALNAEQKKEL